jgi:hypothetical protein
MPSQQSQHLRARAWAIFGTIVAFTFVIGVVTYDPVAPFARVVADGTYRVAQLLK